MMKFSVASAAILVTSLVSVSPLYIHIVISLSTILNLANYTVRHSFTLSLEA